MGSAKYILNGETAKDIIVDNEVPLEASNDAFDIRGSDNTLIDCFTIDTRCRTAAHCDDKQIIPTGLEPNAQYLGAIADNNQFIGGGLDSNGSMQGIFSSDGVHTNLYVANQVITTESEHKITINGLLSGTFENNKDKHGNPIKITLEPLRIGGGLENGFYVLSFKDHSYEPINADQEVQDFRNQKLARYPNANYVYDFDLYLFREISESFADSYEDIESHFNKVMSEYEARTSQISQLRVDRFHSDETTTISRLYLNDEFLCHILEDAHHDIKIKGRTRIPAGTYKIGLRLEGGFNARYSKDRRFKIFHLGMLELQDVPNYKYILIHVGNDHEDTAGCLLTGRWNKRSMTVVESATTYKRVYNLLINSAIEGNLNISIEDNDR